MGQGDDWEIATLGSRQTAAMSRIALSQIGEIGPKANMAAAGEGAVDGEKVHWSAWRNISQWAWVPFSCQRNRLRPTRKYASHCTLRTLIGRRLISVLAALLTVDAIRCAVPLCANPMGRAAELRRKNREHRKA